MVGVGTSERKYMKSNILTHGVAILTGLMLLTSGMAQSAGKHGRKRR